LTPDKPERFFREPWEAGAFALVVSLHEAGDFPWPEWVAAISPEIKAAEKAGNPELGDTYYSEPARVFRRPKLLGRVRS
jgi:nitrile hydratase accessory protein